MLLFFIQRKNGNSYFQDIISCLNGYSKLDIETFLFYFLLFSSVKLRQSIPLHTLLVPTSTLSP